MSSTLLDSITLHRRVATKLTGLSESERLAVEKTLLELQRVPIDKLSLRKLKTPSYHNIYLISAGPSLRLLFVKKKKAINVLDIVHPSDLPLAA